MQSFKSYLFYLILYISFFTFQSLDGFLLVVTSDGTILYSTENISSHLGFHQVDLVHRCLYGIIHPDDHHELKVVLEQTLVPTSCHSHSQVS